MSDTLLAAFLASFLTVAGTYGIDRYKKFLDTKQQNLSILSALSAELSSLKYLIEDRKKNFEAARAALTPKSIVYLPVSYNYFSVFDNLSTEFGLLNAHGSIELIISTYAEVKGLFDSVKDLGNKAQFLQQLSVTPGVSPEVIKIVTENQLKMQDFLLTNQVPKVLQLINDCTQVIDDEKEKLQKDGWF